MIKFVIRVSSELGVKSPAVRKRWTTFLSQNIRKLARQICPKAKVRQEWDGLELVVNQYEDKQFDKLKQQLQELLARTPGIAHFSFAKEGHFSTKKDLVQLCIDHYQHLVSPSQSFAVRVRRKGVHDFKSPEIESAVGAGLLERCPGLHVKLKSPDHLIQIDLNDQNLDLLEAKQLGLGGFPIGTQGSALMLMSGGFDSTAAAYHAMRRGLKVHFVYFDMGAPEQTLIVKSIAEQLWQRYGASHPVRIITVPWHALMADIAANSRPSTAGVVLKRLMLQAASKVAKKAKAEALITGEAVSQVASQTLPNLSLIDKAAELPVFRPLIFTDKHTIIDQVRKLGLEPLCVGIKEVCGSVSIKPSAQVDASLLAADESRLTQGLLQAALTAGEVLSIDRLHTASEKKNTTAQPSIDTKLEAPDVIIDIRHPDEIADRPFPFRDRFANIPVEPIPFYQLLEASEHFERSKQYALYCKEGSMSRLQARHLRNQGFSNIQALADGSEAHNEIVNHSP